MKAIQLGTAKKRITPKITPEIPSINVAQEMAANQTRRGGQFDDFERKIKNRALAKRIKDFARRGE